MKFSDFFAEAKIPFIDCAANLNEFSDQLKPSVGQEFEQFGLELTRLIIENVSVPAEIEKIIQKKAVTPYNPVSAAICK